MVDEVFSVLVKEVYDDLKFNNKKNGLRNGRVILTERAIIKLIFSIKFFELHGLIEVWDTKDEVKRAKVAKEVYEKLFSMVSEELKSKEEEEKEMNELPQDDPDLTLIPVADFTTIGRRLYNPVTNEIADIDYKNWEYAVEGKYNRKVLLEKKTELKRCHIIFDQSKPQGIFRAKNKDHRNEMADFLNLYTQPEWRKEKLNKGDSKEMDANIKLFFDHLFPDVKSRRYVLKWLYNCVTARNETALILCGRKGNGKSTLCLFLRALIGQNYYQVASKGFLKSQFDGQQEDKLVMMLDEQHMNEVGKEAIKASLNRYGALEKKGQDVKNPVRLTANYILCGNDPKQFFIEKDDRRFSVPDLTDQPLQNNGKRLNGPMTDLEIREMLDSLESDVDVQRRFGWHILNHCNYPEHNAIDPLTETESFDTLVKASLADWQKQFILTMVDTEAVTLKELKSLLDIKVGRPKIELFLHEQKRLNGISYAKLVWDSDIKDCLIVSLIHPDYELEEGEVAQDLSSVAYILDEVVKEKTNGALL